MTLQIEKFRKIKNITMELLSAKVGMTRGNLQKLKSGKQDCYTSKLKLLADALNCYPSELLPFEWQKPAEINSQALAEAIHDILLATENKESTGHNLYEKALFIARLYPKRLTNPSAYLTKEEDKIKNNKQAIDTSTL